MACEGPLYVQVACDFEAVASAAAELARGAQGLAAVCWTDGPFPGGVLHVASGRRWGRGGLWIVFFYFYFFFIFKFLIFFGKMN